MPLPKRKSDESREEFIARCMKDPVMVQEFPDAGQRRAICEKQARVKTEGFVNLVSEPGALTIEAAAEGQETADGKPKLPRFSMVAYTGGPSGAATLNAAHAEAHALALKSHVWSSPSRAWSLYTGQLAQEPGRRFHAAIAFRAGIVPGWPETGQPTFDQQLIARLNEQGKPGDPCAAYPPSYVFRWGSTGRYHGQAFMRGNDDTRWYDRAVENTKPAIGRVGVKLELDSETERVFAMLSCVWV